MFPSAGNEESKQSDVRGGKGMMVRTSDSARERAALFTDAVLVLGKEGEVRRLSSEGEIRVRLDGDMFTGFDDFMCLR